MGDARGGLSRLGAQQVLQDGPGHGCHGAGGPDLAAAPRRAGAAVRLEEPDDPPARPYGEDEQRAHPVGGHPARLARVGVRRAEEHLRRHVVLEHPAGERVVHEPVPHPLELLAAVDHRLDVGPVGIEVGQLDVVGPDGRGDAGEHPGQAVERVGGGDLQERVHQPVLPVELLHLHGPGHRLLAHPPDRRGRLLEPRTGATDEVALPVGHVQVGEHRQLVAGLDALGADQGAGPGGEVHDGLEQRGLRRLPVDTGDQRPVHLEQVGADAHHPLQAGVGLAHVVDGDPDAALPEPVEPRGEDVDTLDLLVLGDLDLHAVQVVRQGLEQRGVAQRRRAEVDREDRSRRSAGTGPQRLEHRQHLEAVALPHPAREREDGVDGELRQRREPGEGLVAGDEARRQVQDRLEHDVGLAAAQGVPQPGVHGRGRDGRTRRRPRRARGRLGCHGCSSASQRADRIVSSD